MTNILQRINPRYIICTKKILEKRYNRNSNEENSKLTKKAIVYIWYMFSCNIWHSYFTSGLNDLRMHCRRLYLHVSVCDSSRKTLRRASNLAMQGDQENFRPRPGFTHVFYSPRPAPRAGEETYEVEILRE